MPTPEENLICPLCFNLTDIRMQEEDYRCSVCRRTFTEEDIDQLTEEQQTITNTTMEVYHES